MIEANENMEVSTGKMRKGRRIFLIAAAGVLLAALTVAAVYVFGTTAGLGRIERVLDFNTVMSGVSVNGVDISGLTDEEAAEATEGLNKELLNAHSLTFKVHEDTHTYALEDLSVGTDYEDIIAQAIDYGRTGSFEDRKAAYDKAKSEGMAFTVSLKVEEDKLRTALADLKKELDQAPQDAKAEFMPCGYTLNADGTPIKFEPDPKEMADAHAKGKEIERPALVRIDPADKPNDLRYQYWNNDEYDKKDFIPADAYIARFYYVPELTGFDVNTDAIFDQVMNAIDTGDFSEIEVPTEVTEAALKLDDIKKDTQLIASWTSSYRGHSGYDRNWNVSRMSSFINGAEIQPGEQWSVNKTAGPRNSKTAKTIGWKEAAGLELGGTTPQEGGGVCQLGSTTYNAALRANLTIADFSHHSIPSDYIPKGLDATLSTPTPDLILQNDNTMPVYLVSYVDPKKETVTVEVYGQLPVDPTYGENIIYDFSSENVRRYGSPGSITLYNQTKTPDGKTLSPSRPTIEFASPRAGTKADVYKHILSSTDGKDLCDPILYEEANYRPIQGRVYSYWPESGPPVEETVPVDNQPQPSDPPTQPSDPPAPTEPPQQSTPPAETTPPAESPQTTESTPPA